MPHLSSLFRTSPGDARRRYGAIFWRCFLLVVVLWHGPIPWCHTHGTLANTSTNSPGWLATHLRSCHCSLGLHDDCFLGWHFHVTLPPAEDGNNAEQVPFAEQDHLPSTNVGETLGAMLAGAARTMPAGGQAALVHSELPIAPAADPSLNPGGFYGPFAMSLPLPLRFGILQI